MIIKKGFSLLELTLVLGVGIIVAFIKFQDMKKEQEIVMANAVGTQIKQLGEAVNRYIAIRYDKLSTLSNAANTGSDPGPRTCAGSICTITYQTLINEGLLPVSFTGINVNKSPYTILLKRDGTAPNYVINGLLTTNNSWSEGGKIRYDLLGKAMQAAGIDSGMSKTKSSVAGFSGAWGADAKDFANINQAGILGYRVGYDSSMYSVYLRRDGTLPMTGDLNMGGKNIVNVKDITSSGKITAGDATVYGNLYSGYIHSWGNIGATGSIIASENITARGKLVAWGNITSFKNITAFKDITANGDITARGNLGTWKDITTNGNVKVIKNISANGNIHASGNIHTTENIHAGKDITARGSIASIGRIKTSEYVEIGSISVIGQWCEKNGLISMDKSGGVLSCKANKWTSLDKSLYSRTSLNNLTATAPNTFKYVLVTISSKFSGKDGSHTRFTNYNVYVNGSLIGNIYNSQHVRKGGSKGHSWVYEGYAVAQKSFYYPVPVGANVSVSLIDSAYHIASDVRVDLVN